MSNGRPAPALQSLAEEFFTKLGWKVQGVDSHTLLAEKTVVGKALRWGIYFEDANSFSQAASADMFASQLLSKATDCDFFDLIATDRVFGTGRWSNEVQPLLD